MKIGDAARIVDVRNQHHGEDIRINAIDDDFYYYWFEGTIWYVEKDACLVPLINGWYPPDEEGE
jgi:hypothetical protein